jgi:diguanylate cyclase (GGDEF)-like protein
MQYARSWLCPEPVDRERLLDMDVRIQRARTIGMGFLAVALRVCAPWVGWWPVASIVAVFAVWRLLGSRIKHSRRPEWIIATGWLLSTGAIGLGILLTGAADSPATAWLLVPAIARPARFTPRGVHAGVIVCLVLLFLVTVVAEPDKVGDHPQLFLFPAALICAALSLSLALRDAEIEHRSESVIDQLTGMLNRKALESRTVELELQSRVTGQPVGLIVCDIDNFKLVNDEHGHATGDAVLKDFAYRIRKELRAYDLAYRLGGEEFVVLVPGASIAETKSLAERLRVAIEAGSVGGVEVTASFGVAASQDGLRFSELFPEADAALYRAKTSGRNRVSTADHAIPAVLV